MSELEIPLEKIEVKKELDKKLRNAWQKLYQDKPEAIQIYPVAEVKNKWYIVVAYIEASRLQDMLDAVLDQDGYWIEGEPEFVNTHNGNYVVKKIITIIYKGYKFTYPGTGEGKNAKDADSDAFKRALRPTGLNRFLWQQQQVLVKKTKKTEKIFKYLHPNLKSLGGQIDGERLLLEASPQINTADLSIILEDEDTPAIEDTSDENEDTIKIPEDLREDMLSLMSVKTIEYMEKNYSVEEIKDEITHRKHLLSYAKGLTGVKQITPEIMDKMRYIRRRSDESDEMDEEIFVWSEIKELMKSDAWRDLKSNEKLLALEKKIKESKKENKNE